MQVVLAEDTLQPSRPLVAIKIMKRQHTYTGQKASLPFTLHIAHCLAKQCSIRT